MPSPPPRRIIRPAKSRMDGEPVVSENASTGSTVPFRRSRRTSRSCVNRMSPSASAASPIGATATCVAGVPGADGKNAPYAPLPAIVVIVPSVPIRRIRLKPESATISEPSPDARTSVGRQSVAAVAGPPSPPNGSQEEYGVMLPPVPTMVSITPSGRMRRSRLFQVSVNTTEPSRMRATPSRLPLPGSMSASPAGPPSPENPARTPFRRAVRAPRRPHRRGSRRAPKPWAASVPPRI